MAAASPFCLFSRKYIIFWQEAFDLLTMPGRCYIKGRDLFPAVLRGWLRKSMAGPAGLSARAKGCVVLWEIFRSVSSPTGCAFLLRKA